MTQPDPLAPARAWDEAQQKEYGQYVAATAIDINGVRAYNAGDPVPASNVDRAKSVLGVDWAADGTVVKTGTKAAEKVTGAPSAAVEDSKKGVK